MKKEPQALTNADFDQEVLQNTQPVLVDFWAGWCGPCQMIAPIVAELADEYQGKAKVAKVDIDQNRDLAGKFNVMSIPTLLVFKDGQEVERVVGVTAKNILKEKLDQYLS